MARMRLLFACFCAVGATGIGLADDGELDPPTAVVQLSPDWRVEYRYSGQALNTQPLGEGLQTYTMDWNRTPLSERPLASPIEQGYGWIATPTTLNGPFRCESAGDVKIDLVFTGQPVVIDDQPIYPDHVDVLVDLAAQVRAIGAPLPSVTVSSGMSDPSVSSLDLTESRGKHLVRFDTPGGRGSRTFQQSAVGSFPTFGGVLGATCSASTQLDPRQMHLQRADGGPQQRVGDRYIGHTIWSEWGTLNDFIYGNPNPGQVLQTLSATLEGPWPLAGPYTFPQASGLFPDVTWFWQTPDFTSDYWQGTPTRAYDRPGPVPAVPYFWEAPNQTFLIPRSAMGQPSDVKLTVWDPTDGATKQVTYRYICHYPMEDWREYNYSKDVLNPTNWEDKQQVLASNFYMLNAPNDSVSVQFSYSYSLSTSTVVTTSYSAPTFEAELGAPILGSLKVQSPDIAVSIGKSTVHEDSSGRTETATFHATEGPGVYAVYHVLQQRVHRGTSTHWNRKGESARSRATRWEPSTESRVVVAFRRS